MTTYQGIYPILYAFFKADGTLDRDAMRRQVEASIRHGAHGIAILGLATEANKLSTGERRQVMEWAAEDIAGRLPLAVTISEPNIPEYVAFAKAAAALGANWVVLQPPSGRSVPEIEYIRFFGAVADACPVPVAIQNAAMYLGTGLSDTGLKTLGRNHSNVKILKAEGAAAAIRQTIETTEGMFTVFNGRGGLELPDNLLAGCAGLIPAPECFDVQVKIYNLIRQGGEDNLQQALVLYREILPLIVFLMQSIDNFLCYGKRLTARRLGLKQVFDRAPAQAPDAFGLATLKRYSEYLPIW
ncbi:dihydrodipicolinate synthase family protein [Herbaspirillum sp. RTI4]|uniref:dihydrodipicolinate synthase family protein n=1 Tax=Herbaspirillum sp. RTI4 TaxID=3048640 RepID=UPI002AB5CE74|nr:dihydrodipicolinate synthase family protein [Herbaspirillum sp. RTI4]MDY7578766.1 dihydrodipicolinate synthase family protein [Herbaspirillum sp. RTI4]MEA9982314.1 dihydrodipicolinate synthase family protein [Herbaspirillum sp. RTI4]